MRRWGAWALTLPLCVLGAWACGEQQAEIAVLQRQAADDLTGVISRDGVAVDTQVSTDGRGALRLSATESTTFRLYETGDLDVEAALLTYQAKVRTEGVGGRAYLEMLCSFPGQGEAFSRALPGALSGTNEWSTQRTPFRLEAGQNPDNIRLNMVVEGAGTVWIDEIELLRAPLP
jgi:hypothetical protein